jgi:hypothetical protein
VNASICLIGLVCSAIYLRRAWRPAAVVEAVLE